ncbi:MAG TPA: outer membrane protein assembly factor BamE [Prosthecobacter sp.]|nr:outer membrane protein assembly factor BamE [Prosthecobacter sp.]
MKIASHLLLLGLLFSIGCTSTQSGTEGTATASATAAEEEEAEEPEAGATPPRIGMTKAQVRAKYGTPVNVSVSSRGETWAYVFNNWDGRSLIPYYGAIHSAFKQRHNGIINFDANGRVRDFTWNETNPVGASVWR